MTTLNVKKFITQIIVVKFLYNFENLDPEFDPNWVFN